MDNTIRLKILVVGDVDVGKTSLVYRYQRGTELQQSTNTIGYDISNKEVKIDNKDVFVEIWDTAGEERFRALSPQYFRKASGVLIVYDITRRETFESLGYWIGQCEKYFTDGDIPKILIGNKYDLENRDVTFHEGRNFATQLQIPFYETSKGESVIEFIFTTLLRKILKTRNYEIYTSSDNLFIEPETTDNRLDKKKFTCCSGNTTNLNLSLGKPF